MDAHSCLEDAHSLGQDSPATMQKKGGTRKPALESLNSHKERDVGRSLVVDRNGERSGRYHPVEVGVCARVCQRSQRKCEGLIIRT